MKKFFAKASKPFVQLKSSPDSPLSDNFTAKLSTSAVTLGLQPEYVVHDHLALLATSDGLLVRPYMPGSSLTDRTSYSCVRISWGKHSKIEEIERRCDNLDWKESVVVYGIAGILELFNSSYLLVITSRVELNHVLDPLNIVFAIKSVLDIPLIEECAKSTLNALAARNNALTRPSLLLPVRNEAGLAQDVDERLSKSTFSEASKDLTLRVKFLSHPTDKPLSVTTPGTSDEVFGSSIQRPSSALSNVSDISTSSEASDLKSPVFKTLANRLSFWSRLSKREQRTPISSEYPFIPEPTSLNEERQVLDKLMEEAKEQPTEVIETILASTAPAPVTAEEKHSEIETKIVKECIRELSKGGMYFAYNFDITRSLQHKHDQVLRFQKQQDLLAGLGALPHPDKPDAHTSGPVTPSPLVEPNPTVPLWRRVDKQFWWNEWMMKPFIEAGLHHYILPLMQGFCQIAKFTVPENAEANGEDIPVDYILISRRSKHRPGLRYQRRGIDEAAHVANFVETETIMRIERDGKEHIFAYVQIRGSIPLFWTQTGYGLKPPPLLATDRTREQNLEALKRHFLRTVSAYGPLTAVNLAEQNGRESVVTNAVEEFMQELNMKDTQYCKYDFHAETKGMKYENIHRLIDSMERTFETQGYFWVSNNTVLSHQKGVFRVNCIDCLDRTNVVQSAFARFVLNKQLGALALLNPTNSGRTDADLCFNDVWANNGDAISRAYAGTSALKGDFTRTGKRDIAGMLNDGVNSLARMYTSTFSDWFSQAVIDFMLGNRALSVFSEFLLKLKSTDPRDLIRLSKIRAEAIATSVSRVLPESERLLSGWTLFSPEEINTKVGIKFEEKVLLLSAKALYIVSYDYTLEKVKLYTRIPLGDIVGISIGTYILSPLEESSRDPEQNAGFIVKWICSHQESRVTSYSIRNSLNASGSLPTFPSSISRPRRSRSNTLPILSNVLNSASFIAAGSGKINYAAFKVLPVDSARVRRESSAMSELNVAISDEMQSASTCREAADLVVDRIHRACENVGGGQGHLLVQEDIVSLAEVQRMTSVYTKMEYGVKRLLWFGS